MNLIQKSTISLQIGGSEGLGSIRGRELHEAYAVLGVHSVQILDHP